jgi:hypothetical protein
MNNSEINVIVHSYKSKTIFSAISTLLENSSGDYPIVINFYDQHQFDRSKQLFELMAKYKQHKAIYSHIFWDSIKSPIKIQEEKLINSKSKYILLMCDRTILDKNWDNKMINFIDEKPVIISGNGSIKIKNKNIFFVNTEVSNNDNFSITNYISSSLIFGLKNTFDHFMINGYALPSYLKYYGFEEIMSVQLYSKGVPIYSTPTDLYYVLPYNQLEDFNIYVPFSKTHNYNEVIELFQNNKNKYIEINSQQILRFSQYHNFDFSSLKYLPYPKNDVAYSTQDSRFDKMDGRRFLDGVKRLN